MTAPSFLSDQRLQLLLFGGKGGVGKTTCAASTALYFAGKFPDKSFALVSTDPAHSLNDSFAGSSPPFNLKVVEFDARESLNVFKAKHNPTLREIASRGTFLDEEDIGNFLDLSLPGLDELTALLEISKWVAAGDYDCLIVDTAPTGHTLRLLAMPELIQKWLRALDALLAKHRYMRMIFTGSYKPDELDHFLQELSGMVSQVQNLLQDPVRCRFIPVALAEDMVIRETISLLEILADAKIPVTEIVVNRLLRECTCPVCAEARARQMEELKELITSNSPPGRLLWSIPFYTDEVRGSFRLAAFWKDVAEISAATPPVVDRGSYKAPPRVESASPCWLPEATFLLFSGKGGVGKTTLACATALRLAHDLQGKEVLLFSSDPAHSLSACLGVHVGAAPKRLSDHLTAVEIDAQAEFGRLKTQYQSELEQFLKSTLQNLDLAFDQQAMERILDLSPPGLDEVMALTNVIELLIAGRYDVFVLDAAPTGHFIRLMELPELVNQWLKVFFGLFLKYRTVFKLPKVSQRFVEMSKQLKCLKTLLSDPLRSALYPVGIPTEMAFQETRDLVAACERLNINVPMLFLNFMTPPCGCSFCSTSCERERNVLEMFQAAFPEKQQVLVYRQSAPQGLGSLTELGNALYQSPCDHSPQYVRHGATGNLTDSMNDKEQ